MSLPYAVVESKRHVKAPTPTRRESRPEVTGDSGRRSSVHLRDTAPVTGSWIEAPGGLPTSKAGIEELIVETVDAARNDFGVNAANERNL